MSVPIIFIHKGYNDYMEYSLRQAKHSNRDSKIMLIGDEANDKFDFIAHVNMKNHFTSANEFSKIYKHFSTNPYHYELFCIQRWFILRDYMKENSIKKCFVCDTDVLVYSNIEKALILFGDDRMALIKLGSTYSLGISFILLEKLTLFCNYIGDCYQDDNLLKRLEECYLTTKKKKLLGGVSDMSLATNWIKTLPQDTLGNLLEVRNTTTFDSHIGSPFQVPTDNYKFRLGRKVITWQHNQPYCYSYKYRENILFHLLHFQGPNKYLMAKFYTGKSFAGKLRLDIKFFFANFAAFWYNQLKIRYRFAWLFDLIFKSKKYRNRKLAKP